MIPILNPIRLLTAICLAAVLFGCGKERVFPDPPPAESQNILRISTSIAANGSDAENAIRTLRLFVFDADAGQLLFNKLYLTADAASAGTPGSYSYFIKDSEGNYIISELMSKISIKVLLVANEMSPLEGLNYTVDQIKGTILHYRNMYANGSATDILIDGLGTTSDNKGYIPMFAESGTISHGNWDASSGKVVRLRMVRCLAKVTVLIRSGEMTDPAFTDGDELAIQSVSIGRMPIYGFLGETGIGYRASFTSTSTIPFGKPIVITQKNGTEQVTDQLVFYVPEYMIDQAQTDNGQYCYLQVDAQYTKQSGETTASRYRIPLGNGVGKLYGSSPAGIGMLTPQDLTLSRNNQYNIDATVKTIGSLEALSVNVTVKEWEKTENINGDINTPLLNVSNLVTKMSESKVRVYFWTNQPDPYVEEQGLKNGTDSYRVNDVFREISSTAGNSTPNFQIFTNSSSQYYPYNGYIEFEFDDAGLYTGSPDTYSVVLHTGKLTRTLTVEANPVVGQIVFDANGGTTADGTGKIVQDIRVSDVGLGTYIIGDILTEADPRAQITPPAGKSFSLWSYEKEGLLPVPGISGGMLSVTMTGYVTTLFALWK